MTEARLLRLEQDQWQLAASAVRAYGRDVAEVLGAFGTRRQLLDDIRLLAGPEVNDLPRLSTDYSDSAQRLDQLSPPPEVERLHRLLRQAFGLAGSAARGRYQAVQNGDIDEAWAAASAAAYVNLSSPL